MMKVFDLSEDNVMVDGGAAVAGMATRLFLPLPLTLLRISGFEFAR